MPEVIPVDLTKTGGRLFPPAGPEDPPPPPPPPDPKAHDPKAPDPKAPDPPACPHCGLHPAHPPTEVTPVDQVEFAKAVFAGVPFVRDYSLFGGAVRARFRTLDVDEAEAVMGAMDRLEAAGAFAATPGGAAARFFTAALHHAAAAVDRLVIGGVVHARPAGADPEAAAAWLKTVLRQEPVLSAVREAYLRFAALTGAVQRRAFDPSFSSATAGCGTSPASPPPATRS